MANFDTSTYENIIKGVFNTAVDYMKFMSEYMTNELERKGYKVIYVTKAVGTVTYDGKEYFYKTKSESFETNPLMIYCHPLKLTDNIENKIKDKSNDIIVMYLPIVLDCTSAFLNFSTQYDIIRIVKEN